MHDRAALVHIVRDGNEVVDDLWGNGMNDRWTMMRKLWYVEYSNADWFMKSKFVILGSHFTRPGH